MVSPTPVDYDPPFARNVQGSLYARFRLGPDGAPEFDREFGGFPHFPITVFVHSPKAPEIDEVEYVLDDPTFPDPVRSKSKANDFRAEVWAYGDVPVAVRVRMGDEVYEQRVWLSSMLELGHAKKAAIPAVRTAIQRIKVS